MDEPNKDEENQFKFTLEDKEDLNKNDQTSISQPSAIIEKSDEPALNWSAPNSFSVNKSAVWYLILLAITLIVSAVIYLLTKDKITTAVILISGLLMGIYGAKKPRMVNYQITKRGFTVNGRNYQFGSYRSFAIIQHGDARSAVLTPLKRFMPYMYIYFERENESQITETLTAVLPVEPIHRDTMDRFLRMVGF